MPDDTALLVQFNNSGVTGIVDPAMAIVSLSWAFWASQIGFSKIAG
jgi:hypothetical protein